MNTRTLFLAAIAILALALSENTAAVKYRAPSPRAMLAAAYPALMRGAVINADSMQVYRDLRVITARPRISTDR